MMANSKGQQGHELRSVPENTNAPGIAEIEGDPPSAPPEQLPNHTILKFLTASFSFFVAGVNDGSVGALIPYVIRQYHINTAQTSALYATNFAGWFISAIINTHLTQFFDLGSIMLLGAALQVLAHALRIWNPPFPLFAISFTFVSLGQALNDTHANSFVADARSSHRWLPLIHASYSAGCLVGPFVSTAVAAAATPSVWYYFYAVTLGLCVANTAFIALAFRDTVKFRHKGEISSESRHKDASKLMALTFRSPSLWYLSIFFFFYLGSSLTASGWLVEYLIDVRKGDISQMGFVAAGYNGGTLLGRLLLAEPIHRFGPRYMVFAFGILCIGFQLIFWLVPNIIAASIAVSIVGFFAGPLFATGVSLAAKLFEPDVKPTALAFVFVMAQVGGSLFPIITGGVASSAGVAVLQPMLIALWVATSVSWLLVPQTKKQNLAATHQE
ncbi:unnamed protein product [Clonostachys chloroleuca]|uniref:Major facilitator superfamily (MFS) profile domain-containing protein n=1 Tax=Clonostachys chloroleuca TaxID=1926264 RepID=A0AA35LPD4_9HYPO|nr:unnamed protein product [Clonostachys chloroleuca]